MRNYLKIGLLSMAILALACVAFLPTESDDGAKVSKYSLGDDITLEVLAPESVEGVYEVRIDVEFDSDLVKYNEDGRWLIEGPDGDDSDDFDTTLDHDSIWSVYSDCNCIPQTISQGQKIASMSFSCWDEGSGELRIRISLENQNVIDESEYTFEYVIEDKSNESSDVLVAITQKGQDVCVIMYALDGKAVPSGTFNLKANYTYINEFGDLVSENQSIKLKYESDGSSSAMVSDSSFVEKLDPEEYGHVFCITGTYQFGPMYGNICKTAYSPVTA